MRDQLKDHQIYNKTEYKKAHIEINSLKKENTELLQKVATYQTKVADLELFIGFERKIKKK